MFGSRGPSSRFLLFSLALASLAVCVFAQETSQTDEASKDQTRQPAQFELLAKGVAASAAFQVQFKSAPLRLEIRNLVMGRGETESIPTPTRILLELRQGAVTTTANQQRHEWRQGDFWVVEKNSPFRIQNAGEVAVLRAIYIFEGKR